MDSLLRTLFRFFSELPDGRFWAFYVLLAGVVVCFLYRWVVKE